MAPTGGSPADRQKALERGRLVHRLLQSLPDIPERARAEAARRHIERQDTDFNEAEREEIAGQVLAIMTDPRFAAFLNKLHLPN